jgi:DNA polymerase-3 subunit beta
VEYDGDPLEIGFNAAYLLEILKYIPTDEVRLTFKAPERAATIEPVGWNDPASFLALVMPLRLVD